MKRLALSLLLVLAPAAAAADDLAGRVRERAQARGLAQPEVEALLEPLAQAQALGLPPEPVAEKLLEGLAKGVPAERVAEAARAVGARLGDAQQALAQAGAATDGRAVTALALAESRLGSREALARLAERGRGASAEALVAAASAAAELRAAGVPAEAACDAVGELASHGYRPDQIAAVPRLYGRYRAEGGRDDAAFWGELGRRAERRGQLDDVVDPFGKGGDVLRPADPGEAKPNRGNAEGSNGGSLFSNPDRSGSTPANDQVVPGPQGGSPIKPGKPADKGNNGKAKGKGQNQGDQGNQGNP